MREALLSTALLIAACYSFACGDIIPPRVNTTAFDKIIEARLLKTAVPFTVLFNYTRISSADESNDITEGMGQACYHNEPDSYSSVDEPGYIVTLSPHVELTGVSLRNFKVLKPYNKDSHSVLIQLDITWTEIKGVNYTDFVLSTEQDGILEMFFKSAVDPDSFGDPAINGNSQTKCNATEFFAVPLDWCKHNATYKEKIVNVETQLINDTCQISLRDQITHYIAMWNPGAMAVEYRKRCMEGITTDVEFTDYNASKMQEKYPDVFMCHKTFGSNTKSCKDSIKQNNFNTNGKGLVTKVFLGKSSEDVYDLNLTLYLTHWTYDLPKIFSNSFLYCDWSNETTKLYISMFKKELIIPPARGTPVSFYVWVLFMIAPATMILSAVLLCILTRSNKGFIPTVWEYWKKVKKQNAESPQKTPGK